MGKAGAQPCHRHLENRWTGPNSPSCRVGGVQADQGPYYHSLGSEETVSISPQPLGRFSLIPVPGNEGPFLSWIQVLFLFINHLVSMACNHQSSPTPNPLSTRHAEVFNEYLDGKLSALLLSSLIKQAHPGRAVFWKPTS